MQLKSLFITFLLFMSFYGSYGNQSEENKLTYTYDSKIIQEPSYKNNLELGLSDAIIIQIADMVFSGFKNYSKMIFSDVDYESLGTNHEGIPIMFHLNYGVQLKPRLTLGGGLSFMNLQYTTRYYIESENKTHTFHHTSNYILLQAIIKYEYIKKPLFSLYGKGALGLGFLSNKSIENNHNSTTEYRGNGLFPSFQITPIGMSIGKRVGGYLEIGVGMNGLAQGGIFYKF